MVIVWGEILLTPTALIKKNIVICIKTTLITMYREGFSKQSLLLNFDPVKAEIFEVKDSRGHY